MIGNSVLLDTNIIILASKQKINIEKLFQQYDYFYVSIVTFMEVYGFNFENEEELKSIDKLFETLKIVDVNIAIAEIVIEYRKNHKKKIKLPDAIILATANYIDADLISDDWDDFEGFDKKVKIAKIASYKNS